ncbi:MAG: CDP-diacylglycerol--glycerol-3-phosphate 3-phosphatidyltransferase [Gammaproteobacteria bacterium]|nr:CDP-diacylglycerol--glycerol-3-phosphate 3-phosphatidyltransferase [Gammaproteobacteria bacterium]
MNLPLSLPNILTSLRIILIPVMVLVFYLPFDWRFVGAACLFGLASFTDWVDGYLARRLGQMTPFGAFLDPVADKLIVTVSLVILVEHYATPFFSIPALIIIGREIVVTALREWMAQNREVQGLSVSAMGKFKTGCQMFAIVVLLASGANPHGWLATTGYLMLYGAAFMTILSMFQYLSKAWPHLSMGMKNR